MADGHGGSRDGAGRKKKEEKFAGQIARTEEKIADRLPDYAENLQTLADGGFEQITETWEPAGTVMVDATEIVDTENGPRSVRIKRPAFPDLPPDQLVLVKRVRSFAAPDRAANEYLINRIMGKPAEKHEVDGDGESVPFAIVRLPSKVSSAEEWQEQAKKHASNATSNATSASPS